MSLLPEIREQLRAAAAHQATGPAPALRRHRWRSAGVEALAVAVSVALVVAVAAVILSVRHGRPSSSHPGATVATHHTYLGFPPRQELRYITAATLHVENTPGGPCRSGPPYQPTITGSTPGRPLLSTVGVLHRLRTRQDQLPATLQGLSGGSIYIDYVRRARVTDGVSYFVVPVTAMLMSNHLSHPGCYRAIRAALKAELPRIPARLRAPTLALEAMGAADQRRLRRTGNQPGVCLVESNTHGQAASCGDTVNQLKQFGLISWLGVLAGIVPDGVASVTVEYPPVNGRPAQTATSTVIGNVFVTPLGSRHPRRFRPAMIWRSADGRIIKKTPYLGPLSGLHYAGWCSENRPNSIC